MQARFFFSVLVLLSTISLSAQDELHREYIDLFKDIAIKEMDRTGIPASIKLAQALLESQAGTSELASESNNHFGIKCGGDWTGRSYFIKDDDYDNNGTLLHSCFRVYEDPEESFVAHSDFLMNPKKEYRYGFLFKIKNKNYKKWAKGLKKAGYATSKTYDKKLISLIERYKLYEYDKMSAEDVVASAKPKDKKADDPKTEVAGKTDNGFLDVLIPVKAEEEIIDRANKDAQAKAENRRLDKVDNGRREWHFVEEGESMEDIAEKYDLRLSKLLRRNRMKRGEEPALGVKIKLRGRKLRETPTLRAEEEIVTTKKKKETTPPAPVLVSNDKKEKQQASDESPEREKDKDTLLDMDTEDAIDLNKVEAPKKDKKPSTKVPIVESKDHYEEKVTAPEKETPAKKETTKIETEPQKEETTVVTDELEEGATYYVVQKGDTLWSIALKHRTTVEEVRDLNKLDGSNIRRGMKLRVK